MHLIYEVNLIFTAPFNLTWLNPCALTCRRGVTKQQISLATHRNEPMGYEGPSGSHTHVDVCAARRPRPRVSLQAQPYQCFTDTFFFRPLSSPDATLSSFFFFDPRTSCPCLGSGSHSLTRDVFPLRTARDAAVIAWATQPLTCDRRHEAAAEELRDGDGFVLTTAGSSRTPLSLQRFSHACCAGWCFVLFLFSQSERRWFSSGKVQCYASEALPSEMWLVEGPVKHQF